MNEKMPKASGGANRELQIDSNHQQYPTPEQLREFEGIKNASLLDEESIESFARDPANPTETEIEEMDRYNASRPKLFDITFEEFFGYPDPRDTTSDPPGKSSGR
ncbi:hypothetical protein ACQPZF_05610 [Actinosynnema sp. CS-041913]|uniref:hypothetical protein n=1 Tax=Actinosynnema sp. CS-041913 TaxID=3239917 RepID=UPI003D8DAE87